MKQIEISLWEITKEEAKQLPPYTQVLIFNTFTGTYNIEYAGEKRGIVHSKYASEFLRYFSFDKPSEGGAEK